MTSLWDMSQEELDRDPRIPDEPVVLISRPCPDDPGKVEFRIARQVAECYTLREGRRVPSGVTFRSISEPDWQAWSHTLYMRGDQSQRDLNILTVSQSNWALLKRSLSELNAILKEAPL